MGIIPSLQMSRLGKVKGFSQVCIPVTCRDRAWIQIFLTPKVSLFYCVPLILHMIKKENQRNEQNCVKSWDYFYLLSSTILNYEIQRISNLNYMMLS